MCELCKRAVKPVEGKVILALRQEKSLLTSTTGPVHTFPTHYFLQHSVGVGNSPNYFMYPFLSFYLFQHLLFSALSFLPFWSS